MNSQEGKSVKHSYGLFKSQQVFSMSGKKQKKKARKGRGMKDGGKKKKVNTVGGSGHRQECRELALINPKRAGKRLNTVANFRTMPVKYDSDIQSR